MWKPSRAPAAPGLGAGDPADDEGAAGTEAPADDAADASGQGAAGASGAEGGASR
ncbi:MAG: hypothetical protein ACLTDR_08110 [Adlercreutzia equolifaciens]